MNNQVTPWRAARKANLLIKAGCPQWVNNNITPNTNNTKTT